MIPYTTTEQYGPLFHAKSALAVIGFSSENRQCINNALSRHCPQSKQAMEYGVSIKGVRKNAVLLTLDELNTLITHCQFGCHELIQWLIESGFDATPRAVGREELAALATIEQIVGITLLRQYAVGPYRIDGYDAVNNVAYEIDEAYHISQVDADHQRQAYIESELGCKFVRIKI